MIHVVVAAPPRVVTPADLRTRLPACADLIELRLDLLDLDLTHDDDDLKPWIEASPRPVMATLRSATEGGAFSGSPAEAARILGRAARAGAAWIDVEAAVAPYITRLPPVVRVLISHHGEGEVTPPDTVGDRPVAHVKIARPVDDAVGIERLVKEVREAGPSWSFVPFGALAGLRAAVVRPGGLLYGSAASESGVVRGQPALIDLLDEGRAGEVGPEAARFGLLGRPSSRSPSPALHNAAFRALGLEALYVALPELPPRDACRLPFEGFSVTTPWKAEALAMASEADDAARRAGAANTLRRLGGGGWHAANTDVDAIAGAVPTAADGESAFIYGVGGYARAAVVALRARGYGVRLGARRSEAGETLAQELDAPFAGGFYERRPGDRVVVNATPCGVRGEPVPAFDGVDWSGLRLLDAPYRTPSEPTTLVRAARAVGAEAVDGLRLLRAQAARQVEIFAGRAVTDDVLALALAPPRPLLLLGLRGAGKSSVGRTVARRLGRPYLDLDAEITRVTGVPPSVWLRECGETAFRAVELDALSRIEGRRGIVVAGGGGVLEHPEAAELARRVATAVLLDVPPEVAAARVRGDATDRPALVPGESPLDEAVRLHARRAGTWREVAAHVVNAEAGVADVARRVGTIWGVPNIA